MGVQGGVGKPLEKGKILNELVLPISKDRFQRRRRDAGGDFIANERAVRVIRKGVMVLPFSEFANGGVYAHIGELIALAVLGKFMLSGPAQAARKAQDGGAIAEVLRLLDGLHEGKGRVQAG